MAELDLNQLLQGGTVELRRQETADERQARLRREDREHRLAQTRHMILFSVIVVGIVAITVVSAWKAFDPATSAEGRKIAETILTAIVSGALGYVIGKSRVAA